MTQTDSRGRPRDYNAVARHRDLLEDSVELAVPKLNRVMALLDSGNVTWEARELLRRASHDLTVGTE